MLTVKDAYKKYKKQTVLENISVTIGPGVHGLIGANGAGKTSLLKLLAGTITPNQGHVEYDGVPVTKEPDRLRRDLGFLPQHFDALANETPMSYLTTVAKIKLRQSTTACKKEARRCLESVNLCEAANTKVKKLSTGMKQRLGVAQSIIGDPKLLIFDEPTVGLDPVERVRFRHLITELGKTSTVILSTHVVDDIVGVCSHLMVLDHGRLLYKGDTEDLAEFAEGHVWRFESGMDLSAKSGAFLLDRRNRKNVYKWIGHYPPQTDATPISPSIIDGYLYLTGSYSE